MSKRNWAIKLTRIGPVIGKIDNTNGMKFKDAKASILKILNDQIKFYSRATPTNYKYNILEGIYEEKSKEQDDDSTK